MPQHPTGFEAYPGERFIEIIEAWITHPWPMTPVQAKELYESLGYRVTPQNQDYSSQSMLRKNPILSSRRITTE